MTWMLLPGLAEMRAVIRIGWTDDWTSQLDMEGMGVVFNACEGRWGVTVNDALET
jgi:hypothetical protein